ncbi:Alpha-12 giardin [Giardia muris]|uniref:Alpha-12 giardin n=1 Tax=Giardia muris TaxID=5742 RepID=A0A142C642_GIAMU|nr:alpha-12 giardin [Giardia muris]TNJ29009.1 Alpha-12 giardin [Giardia muris]|eukprot:TNJ29009.1 Alpha-12 giardin [Giardia muris]
MDLCPALLARELAAALSAGDRSIPLVFSLRYRNAERVLIAKDYEILTGEPLASAFSRLLPTPRAARLISDAWLPFDLYRAILFERALATRDHRFQLASLTLTCSPADWEGASRAYLERTRIDLGAALKRVCDQDSFLGRLCLSWIAFRREPRGNIADDVTSLAVALGLTQPSEPLAEETPGPNTTSGRSRSRRARSATRKPKSGTTTRKLARQGYDCDALLRLLGTLTSAEWGKVVIGFRVRYGQTPFEAAASTLPSEVLYAFQLAGYVLEDIVTGVAFLLRNCVERRCPDEFISLAALYGEKCNNLRLTYERFGDLRTDIAELFDVETAGVCRTVLQVRESEEVRRAGLTARTSTTASTAVSSGIGRSGTSRFVV